MGDAVLVVEGLTKTYRVGLRRRIVRAVEGLDLEVERGEIFGFLGPNGAGKSTTIKMLMGLVFPTSGSATIFGNPIASTAARSVIGFLPENPYFHDFLTPERLLVQAGRLSGISNATLATRIPQLLDLVGLSRARGLSLRRFSKGMVQRAGIAQALINDPQLLILDEPMSGLDPLGRKDVREIIFRLKEQGKTVFFSSHILPDVEAICDRVAIVLGGKVREYGRLEELLSARTEAVDVIAERISGEAARVLARMSARVMPKGDGVALTFSGEDAAAMAIQTIVQCGGRIVSVTRHRETLEDLFLRRAAELDHRRTE